MYSKKDFDVLKRRLIWYLCGRKRDLHGGKDSKKISSCNFSCLCVSPSD